MTRNGSCTGALWPKAKAVRSALMGWTRKWHRSAGNFSHAELAAGAGITSVSGGIRRIHAYNFLLWHEEDQARRKDVSDSTIARVKRAIDKFNQRRNDSIEKLDELLTAGLQERKIPRRGARLHSETPGAILDRLSILALKVFHMDEAARRRRSSRGLRAECKAKLKVLRKQSRDLGSCLDDLARDILAGRRTFRVYRQYKMYNDPRLNPLLAAARKRRTKTRKTSARSSPKGR